MMKSKTAALTLAAAVCAVLSGCGAAGATTTAPHATHAPVTVTAPAPTAPQQTTPAPAAPSVPLCVTLLGGAGSMVAATYEASSCTMDGNTIDLTGSAADPNGRYITYPNGLTVTLGEVQQMPDSFAGSLPAGDTLVRVDLTVTNAGTTPVDLSALHNMQAAFAVTYGAGVTAQTNGGVIDGANTLPLVVQRDAPAVAVPGGRADVYESFSVPVAQLASMSVFVQPAAAGYTPYRFTNVDTVMVPFH